MERFTSFLLARDRLGHRFSLSYKGRESHSTWLGTALSVTISILVLVILGVKLIEMVYMTDPDIQLYKRQIFQEEV